MSDLEDGGGVDWDDLRAKAVEAAARAYAPYSRLHVGVAALTDDGRLLQACNVENASYGLGLCAECGLVSRLHSSGGGMLVALACRSGTGELLMPCGRCRQLLWEHGGPDLLVDTPRGVRPMTDVLPDAFGARDLPSRAVDQ
jgi:cytidine deaminase